MTSIANLQPEPAPILACTVSRDVQFFELLIDEMENQLGEAWGDLDFEDALLFFDQPDANALEFIALAVDAQDEANLGRIGEVVAQAHARGIKVILVANQISPVALHQMMRLGAEDFVPYPLPEGALAEALARIRRPKTAPVPPTPAAEAPPAFAAKGDRQGVLLPVHGMAGGTGASTFAANLAWELTQIDRKDPPRVCLLDLNFQYGSIATYLDLARKDSVFDLLTEAHSADSDQLIRTLQTYNDKLHVLTAPADMLPLDIISPEDMGRLIDMAMANFDFVVIDMPSTVVAWTEAVITRAHVYFALLQLDLRSAQNVLRFVRALKAEALPHEKLRYVLNRAPKFTDLSAKGRVKRMAESLDIQIELQLPDGGNAVTQANDHGLALAESCAKNPLRKELQSLAKSLFELSRTADSAPR